MAKISNLIGTVRTSSGNVGIGTTNPTEALTVAGNILSTGSLSAGNVSLSAGNIIASGTVAGSSAFTFRNKIINGGMLIDQRNNGGVINIPFSLGSLRSVDRFAVVAGVTGAVLSAQQLSADMPAGFARSLKVTVGTGSSAPTSLQYGAIEHVIEGQNLTDLQYGTASAKPVTLSFWVKCSTTGTFAGSWRIGTSGTYQSYVFTYTINSANTWEYKTITIPGNTSQSIPPNNGVGAYLFITLGAGTSYTTSSTNQWLGSDTNAINATGSTSLIQTTGATFFITGIQVEVGSVATPFEHRPVGTELTLCQRYYCVVRWDAQTPASGSTVVTIRYPVTMRGVPTSALINAGTVSSGVTINTDAAGLPNRTTTGTYAQISTSSGNGYVINREIGFEAEI